MLRQQEERHGLTLLLVLYWRENTKEICEYKRYAIKSIQSKLVSLDWLTTHIKSYVENGFCPYKTTFSTPNISIIYAHRLNVRSLIGKCLFGANLTGVNLIGADLNGADLIGANLNGADLSGAYLTRPVCPIFSNASLTGATLCNTETPWGIDDSGC